MFSIPVFIDKGDNSTILHVKVSYKNFKMTSHTIIGYSTYPAEKSGVEVKKLKCKINFALVLKPLNARNKKSSK